jgi:hypothetical protein
LNFDTFFIISKFSLDVQISFDKVFCFELSLIDRTIVRKKKERKNCINMPSGGAAELGHNFHPGGRKTRLNSEITTTLA